MYKNNLNGATPKKKIFLSDGTELRLCVGAVARHGSAKLYCSDQGTFFSLSRRGLNQVKCFRTKNFHRKPNVHSNYPRMCNWVGNPTCHILVALAWIGPRRDKQECHHLNGNLNDNRADNLIWLSHEEHRRYDAELRRRRSNHTAKQIVRAERDKN